MAFSNYKSIGAVVKEFQITYTEADFIVETEFNIPDYFREDLQTVMREGVVDNSELAICENLIYPVLKEVWKCYRSKFLLWSHKSLTYDENLSGFPEDKFNDTWGQCLADMITAQRLNEESEMIVFGIVSNGDRWQFGKLEADTFTRNITLYSIQELDKLFAAVNYIFRQCELQLDE